MAPSRASDALPGPQTCQLRIRVSGAKPLALILGSLQFVPMSRLTDPLRRLRRVIELAERVLEGLASPPFDEEMFERHLAFRWVPGRATRGSGPRSRGTDGRLVPIEQPDHFDPEDLVGVDRAVERLVANFEQFMAGFSSNHVLLFGERGTGKSSAVKSLLARFGGQGLRIVEVHRENLEDLAEIFDLLRGISSRFVLFCDDLAFDAADERHRELKAALDGSLLSPPANVRIVATSNRRYLLPERMEDNRDARLDEAGELHMGETVDEKLALSDRFGLLLGFYGFDQETYLAIVTHYARKAGVEVAPDLLREAALRWALHRSNRSGRTAKQFVDDFAGAEALQRSRE